MTSPYIIDISNRKLNDRRRPFLQKFLIKNLLSKPESTDLGKNEKKNEIVFKSLRNRYISDDDTPLFFIQQQLLYTNSIQIKHTPPQFTHVDQSQFRRVILRGLASHQNYLIL